MEKLQANKHVVQEMIERVWRHRRIDELPNSWTVDCLNHADPAREKRGLAALHDYHAGFAHWFADFDRIEIEVLQQIAQQDCVATQIGLRAVHTLSQRNVAFATIRIDRLEEGKIADHWSVADMAGLAQQLA